MPRPASIALLIAGLTGVAGGLWAQMQDPKVEPPPSRGGHVKRDPDTGQSIYLDYECPPTLEDGRKNPPDPGNGLDRNAVDKDNSTPPKPRTATDYFMGSWQYIDAAGNDVKVTKWCINQPETRGPTGALVAFNDYFTFQIETSQAGVEGEVTRVKPGPDAMT